MIKKVLVGSSIICAVAIVVLGTYFIVDYSNRGKNHKYEAVVINDDTNFNTSLEYSTNIVPGGTSVQDIKVKSLLDRKVYCNFKFQTEQKTDFSMLNVKITYLNDQLENNSLSNILNQNCSYSCPVEQNSESTIHIEYSLSFDYLGDIDSWDFQILMEAR